VILAVISIYALSNVGSEQHGDHVEAEGLRVVMSIQNVTPSGLSFAFENTAKKEYTYGESYKLYILKNDSWTPVEPVIENGAFIAIGYRLAPNTKTDMIDVNWKWLYGEIADGQYKFQKDILFTRSPGDNDIYVLEQEFSIP
jgi:hypothetical protein